MPFKITLEFVAEKAPEYVFRLAFHSSTERLLMPYPEVIGLRFHRERGNIVEDWATSFLEVAPQDDFVLNPDARIAFDLTAVVNVDSSANLAPPERPKWSIELPEGELTADYTYEVDADWARYDYLAKDSRFAQITPPWGGSITSNAVRFTVAESNLS